MSTNAFIPQVGTVNVAVTAAAQTISPPYTPGQSQDAYRFVNVGTSAVFFLFGAAPVVTVANGIPLLPNSVAVLRGPPNATFQAIGAAVGSSLYVTPGSGIWSG